MKKALTIAALASLALAANDFGYDDELMSIQIRSYLAENPEILRDALNTVKNVSVKKFDDDEFMTFQAQTYLAENPQILRDALKTVRNVNVKKFDDDELFKCIPPWKLQQRHNPSFPKKPVSSVPIAQQHDNEELFNLGEMLKNNGYNIYKDAKTHNYGGAITRGVQTVKVIKRHDDDEFFSLEQAEESFKIASRNQEAIKKASEIIKKLNRYDDDELFMAGNGGCIRRPQKGPLSDWKKPFSPSVPVPQQHDDEELFNLGGLINDGFNIYKDVKTRNYGDLVNHGVQTVKDIKQATYGKRFLGH